MGERIVECDCCKKKIKEEDAIEYDYYDTMQYHCYGWLCMECHND